MTFELYGRTHSAVKYLTRSQYRANEVIDIACGLSVLYTLLIWLSITTPTGEYTFIDVVYYVVSIINLSVLFFIWNRCAVYTARQYNGTWLKWFAYDLRALLFFLGKLSFDVLSRILLFTNLAVRETLSVLFNLVFYVTKLNKLISTTVQQFNYWPIVWGEFSVRFNSLSLLVSVRHRIISMLLYYLCRVI